MTTSNLASRIHILRIDYEEKKNFYQKNSKLNTRSLKKRKSILTIQISSDLKQCTTQLSLPFPYSIPNQRNRKTLNKESSDQIAWQISLRKSKNFPSVIQKFQKSISTTQIFSDLKHTARNEMLNLNVRLNSYFPCPYSIPNDKRSDLSPKLQENT